ncbi:MAG TPA: hypothetical protein VFE42_18420 [Chloroflexota bacterium]|nr:hypothetical protein [Chloroflexota bacterium]
MTEDDVAAYIDHLCAHLPPAYSHLTSEQVRAVLDAESDYFERRFGPTQGWRALLRSLFIRGDPTPREIERERPAFEAYVVQALGSRGDLTPDEIRVIMDVEGEAGPLWQRPPRDKSAQARDR